jgi:hypothetical protein
MTSTLHILDLDHSLRPGCSSCRELSIYIFGFSVTNSHAHVGIRSGSLDFFTILTLGLPRGFLF